MTTPTDVTCFFQEFTKTASTTEILTEIGVQYTRGLGAA